MLGKKSGRVVRFTSLTGGVIVKKKIFDMYEVGYYSEHWYPHDDTRHWTLYSPLWLKQTKKD